MPVKWSSELDQRREVYYLWKASPEGQKESKNYRRVLPPKLSSAEVAEIEEYEKTCWTCRGMSAGHETEIICPKHAADRALFRALRIGGVDVDDCLELGRLSEAFDACILARVDLENIERRVSDLESPQ